MNKHESSNTNKKPKIQRSLEDRIEALSNHISLLREYHNKAFVENNPKYYGEVAGKLRLLIYRSQTCHPLLCDLMLELGIDVRLDLFGPGNRSADIKEFFNNICGAFRSSDDSALIEVTRMQIISTWAQQMGASHEDKSLDKDFAELISHGVFINNRQIAVDELRRSSEFVLLVADYFFEDVKKLGK